MQVNHMTLKLNGVCVLVPYNECAMECMTLYVNGAIIPFSLNLATFHLN